MRICSTDLCPNNQTTTTMDQSKIEFPVCSTCSGLKPFETEYFIVRPRTDSCQCQPLPPSPPPAEWAIVSLMGHCTFAGKVTEETKFGTTLGRCDIPQSDGSFVTRYFPGSSLYSLVVCTEAAAKARAGITPAPVGVLALPAESDEDGSEDDHEDDNDVPY